MNREYFATIWYLIVLFTEMPKFYFMVKQETYHSLAIVPDMPVMASTRWWLVTHLLLALAHITAFYAFIYSNLNKRYIEYVNITNQILSITVACNMTSSTNMSPLQAFLFNMVALSSFVLVWRYIYNRFTLGKIDKRLNAFIYLYWSLISIASIVQISVMIVKFNE